MTDMPIFMHFLYSVFATIGFAVFFNAPSRLLVPSGIIGGIGWIIYLHFLGISESTAFAGFVAGAFVSLCSEVLARKMKQPAIVIVIPGILPLVPGIGLYNTMLFTIQKNYSMAAAKGSDALFLSAAIALGVLVITSLVKTINTVKARQLAEIKRRKLAKKAIKSTNSSELNPQVDNYSESKEDVLIETENKDDNYEYEVLGLKSDSNIPCDDSIYNNSTSIDFDVDDLEPKNQ